MNLPDVVNIFSFGNALAPSALMVIAALLPSAQVLSVPSLWRAFTTLSTLAVAAAVLTAVIRPDPIILAPAFSTSAFASAVGILVQVLGTVIGAFSARYLQGERGQRRYVAALAAVLAGVQLLLLAAHWLVLIAAWAAVGVALQHLLCFYRDRPFALLAAHKKHISDRLADMLLIAAAGTTWWCVGSGSFADIERYIAANGMSVALHASAVLLVLAVLLRMALLPVHGWLIQVMEAPTPVSALLHAGVVNLGGFVLIRMAPLLEHATAARVILVAIGLATAVLAGLVMLTRISIKVKLAWSTVAQMGFLALECGLGLYTLAALHLIGHSLYKAHCFLSASAVVRETRLENMASVQPVMSISLWLAPLFAIAAVLMVETALGFSAWPRWWSAILGLAWAPALWLPHRSACNARTAIRTGLFGIAMVVALTLAGVLVHHLPLDISDSPDTVLGLIALAGMGGLYQCIVLIQLRPEKMDAWRRRSYAGFYLDEIYTQFALRFWPTGWMR